MQKTWKMQKTSAENAENAENSDNLYPYNIENTENLLYQKWTLQKGLGCGPKSLIKVQIAINCGPFPQIDPNGGQLRQPAPLQ